MKAATTNRFVRSLDLVIDFATIGEYRVIAPEERRAVPDSAIWARDIEWTQVTREREIVCSLPRARDRSRARARIRS